MCFKSGTKATCGHGLSFSLGLCRSCYEKQLRGRNKAFTERQRKSSKEWAKNNPEKVRETHKEYRIKHGLEISRSKREWSLNSKYGLTENEYNLILKKQKGKCIICGKKQKKTLSVDHCHKTGWIRGLLCFRCNFGLGWFSDKIETFKKIVDYLNNKKEWYKVTKPKNINPKNYYSRKIHVGYSRKIK
jgi:hypothetical protein